jgi:hypothetical protein
MSKVNLIYFPGNLSLVVALVRGPKKQLPVAASKPVRHIITSSKNCADFVREGLLRIPAFSPELSQGGRGYFYG